MNGTIIIRPGDAEALVAAARQVAWRSGLDLNAMDSLVRKVANTARRETVRLLTRPADNDGGSGG